MSSLVTKSHGSEIKKASEFFKLGLFDLLSILLQKFFSDNWFCLWLLLAILGKILFKLIETNNITSYEPRSGAAWIWGPKGTKTVPSKSTQNERGLMYKVQCPHVLPESGLSFPQSKQKCHQCRMVPFHHRFGMVTTTSRVRAVPTLAVRAGAAMPINCVQKHASPKPQTFQVLNFALTPFHTRNRKGQTSHVQATCLCAGYFFGLFYWREHAWTSKCMLHALRLRCFVWQIPAEE